MLPIYTFLALLFWSAAGFPDSAPDPLFTQALQSFKSGETNKSLEEFTTLLKQNPSDPTILYNLGLLKFTNGQLGYAAAYWRKALYKSPGFRPALKGLDKINSKLPTSNESFTSDIFRRISITPLLLSSLISFIFAGFLWLFMAIRQKEGRTLSWWQPILVSMFCLTLLVITTIHYQHSVKETATILNNDTDIFSSPSEEAPSLQSFSEGTLVTVLRHEGPWTQVQKSDTEVGWAKNETILVHQSAQ